MVAVKAQERKRLQIFLLDRAKNRAARFASLHPRLVASVAELRECARGASRDSLWVSYANDLTQALVKQLCAAESTSGSGIFLHSLDVKTIPALTSRLRNFAFAVDGGFIPAKELAEVLKAENRSDLFIGGCVDRATETITFWRGDLKPLTVPFAAFARSGDGTEPDFGRFSVIDSGQTVRLGGYEAAVDAILYENDHKYRRRALKRRLQEDRSFGASLRRLRKQRGLRREDFAPELSAKTISRIEQGRVQRVRKKTLKLLAARLAVDPQEIATF
jgi:DNA-binding Xre family transcriptional regulator